MANLPETSVFTEGVYQLEITDPVEGGESGVSNSQAKALANRTKWLKEQTDAILPFIPKNRGYISGVNPGASTVPARSGDITAVSVVSSAGNATTYLCTMPTMGSTNYFVRMSVQSLGVINADHDCGSPVFKIISATQFQLSIADVVGGSEQNLRIHFEITNL